MDFFINDLIDLYATDKERAIFLFKKLPVEFVEKTFKNRNLELDHILDELRQEGF